MKNSLRKISETRSFTIPAIDLSCFESSSADAVVARKAAAQALDRACSQIGFFYLYLPGLEDAAVRLLKRCHEFHDLPEDVKMSVSSQLSPMRRGYNVTWKPGNGGSCAARAYVDPPDPKEVLMFGSEELDTTGDITRSEKSSTIHNGKSPMHGPNLWPDPEVLPEGWRASLESDWSTMLGGARTLAKALAAALGEPPDVFDEAMREPATVLILLRYDASKLTAGSSTGCGAHTDCGFVVSRVPFSLSYLRVEN